MFYDYDYVHEFYISMENIFTNSFNMIVGFQLFIEYGKIFRPVFLYSCFELGCRLDFS